MKIATIEMVYNSMGDKGYQQIDKADYVNVRGDMNYAFRKKEELMADSIIILSDD